MFDPTPPSPRPGSVEQAGWEPEGLTPESLGWAPQVWNLFTQTEWFY